MLSSRSGTYLAEMRKRQGASLREVADRMGRGGLSKQALSLIENGHMRIAGARLAMIKRAYKLSSSETSGI